MLILFRTLIWLAIFCIAATQARAGQDASQSEKRALGQVQAEGLSTKQAKKMLVMVLRHERLMSDQPGFNIEAIEKSVPGYIIFFVTLDSPRASATNVIGSFAVSPLTGDVWETNLCKRYTFKALKKIQAEIILRTRKTFASEVNERRHLGCTND